MTLKRALLKLSGESLSGNASSIDAESLKRTALEIKTALDASNIQLAVVIGGGNLWRGADKSMDRVTADKIGMLATVMNSLALNDALKEAGLKSKVFSACGVSGFAEPFNREKAVKCLEKGCIAIFAGGTGNPFFTTDTTAALRAAEIKAGVLLKATQVDGIYSADPKKDANAVKYDSLSFSEAIEKRLKIMDAEAFSLCMHSNISISVFDFYKDGNLCKILNGEKIGTTVNK
ncbi:MAG: UMP kinase [Endomicrobia bacterium]|nr:UMP kinase [Endomicrobiia bacterium]MCL2798683.1 UMP kinase [Endomicrobiia bacterium]